MWPLWIVSIGTMAPDGRLPRHRAARRAPLTHGADDILPYRDQRERRTGSPASTAEVVITRNARTGLRSGRSATVDTCGDVRCISEVDA